MGRVRLGSDVRVMSGPVQNGRVEIRKKMQQVDEVILMVPQVVSSGARDADLVLPAEFESVGFISNLREEPKPVFWGGCAVFDHLRELVDFGGNERHGGRKDGIELAEVGKVPGEVEGEGIEGMCVLCEESKRVDRRWIGHSCRKQGGPPRTNVTHGFLSHVKALLNAIRIGNVQRFASGVVRSSGRYPMSI